MGMRKRQCKRCDKDFTTHHYGKIYCDEPCQRADARDRRPKATPTFEKRKARMLTNTFFCWIINECRRAGTVQILTDVNLPLLRQLFDYRHQIGSWDPVSRSNRYELCHKAPVKGEDSIGLLNHENLYVGRSSYNRMHGNRVFAGAGLSIPKDKLERKWNVTEQMTNKEIVKKIEKFLGAKLVDYAKEYTIDNSNHERMANRIFKAGKSGHTLSELQSMDSDTLRQLEADTKGKRVFKIPRKRSARTALVLLTECERFKDDNASCRMLIPYLRLLCIVLRQQGEIGFESIIPNESLPYLPEIEVWTDWSKFRDWLVITAHEALQGAQISESNVQRKFLKDLIVLEEMPNIDQDLSFYPDALSAVIQLRADLWVAGLSVDVVCNSVIRHSSKLSVTRPSATIQMTKTGNNKEKSAWHYQVLSNDSETILRREKLKDCWIGMDKHSQQEPMQYLMAS